MGSVLFEVTIILCIASFLAILFRFFKQPVILAYLLTGIFIGPFGQLHLQNQETIRAMGDFGIALLLFILGLEFKLKELKIVGRHILGIGFLQVIITIICGYFLAMFFGMSSIASFYISIALAFSSTIITVTILTDKKESSSLYGKITIGTLLVQDIFAVMVLVFLSGFSATSLNASISTFFLIAIKAAILFGIVAILSKSVLPKIIHRLASSLDVLFLFTLAWVLGVTAITSSNMIGFPVVIGGFLAGLALANTSESIQIASRVRVLRDFFATMFFVTLGMQMTFGSLSQIWLPAGIFLLFVLLVKPFIVMLLMRMYGYHKRIAFLTAVNLGQISEFSFIIIYLGSRLGYVSNDVVSLITFVGIASFAASTYSISYSRKLYTVFGKYIPFFQNKTKELEASGPIKNHVVLVGVHRMGESILETLRHEKENIIVVDFNPDIISFLQEKQIPHVFGDISDLEIQEKAQVPAAKLVISTVPEAESNALLIAGHNAKNGKALLIVVAQSREDARRLYKMGADYVVLPDLIGGTQVAALLRDSSLKEELAKLAAKDKKKLLL